MSASTAFGTIGEHGTPAAFFETLHFCPGCGTNYESTGQSEFSRVSRLLVPRVGRARCRCCRRRWSASLRGQQDLDPVARKFLAFSDNRQDASLQAGHFNDFVLVALIRSALLRRRATPAREEPRRTADRRGPRRAKDRRLGSRSPRPEVRTWSPDADPRDREAHQEARCATSSPISIWADLRRGWRITMPNLEQTGQLVLSYLLGLDELAAEETRGGADAGEPLASADRIHPCRKIMRVLLDELRRNLCVATEHLTEEKYDVDAAAGPTSATDAVLATLQPSREPTPRSAYTDVPAEGRRPWQPQRHLPQRARASTGSGCVARSASPGIRTTPSSPLMPLAVIDTLMTRMEKYWAARSDRASRTGRSATN